MRKLNQILVILGLFLGQQALADNDTIRVGMECNYAPFNWTQVKASEYAVPLADGISYCDGYDVQIAKIIAKNLNKKLEIKANPVFEALLTDVQMNNIDLIIAGMSDTEKRRSAVDFSDVYYNSDLVIVVKKDSKYASANKLVDFKGANIGAQIGTFHDDMIEQIPEVKHATPLQSFPLLTVALKSNTLDGFVSEKAVALSIVKSNPQLKFVEFLPKQGFNLNAEDVTVSIGLAKGNQQLKEQVNQVLKTLSQQDRDRLMQEAIERQPN